MRSYELLEPMNKDGERHEIGAIVELDEKTARDKLEIGAVKLAEKQKASPPPPPAPPSPPSPPSPPAPPPPAADAPKPLADQSFEELKAIAKAEKVKGWGLIKAEDKLREAIEAHRGRKAS